eukprot:3090492-Amphidinium_carterae.1
MAWVRNELDPRKGMVTTLCDWRNSDVERILSLQKEKDEFMNKIQTSRSIGWERTVTCTVMMFS